MIDLTGLRSTTAVAIIGNNASGVAYIARVTTENQDKVFGVSLMCHVPPAGGDPDLNFELDT